MNPSFLRAILLLPAIVCVLFPHTGRASTAYDEIDQPPHDYWSRPLNDPFTAFKTRLESGTIRLDDSGELPFLSSVLQALDVPASSQTLVFSTTSLQLSLISPSNPRAIYFNEDVYIGFIPRGKIEVVSLDPDLGAVFYIFNIPRGAGDAVRVERSDRCMNCHAREDTGYVPGLVLKSVLPGPTGGSLRSFRRGQTGHAIPVEERLGGWYVTGSGEFTNHWGNLVGQASAGIISSNRVEPGARFRWEKYPVATSDLLPHLLHEHQAGFVNRVVEATYRARAYAHADGDALAEEHAAELDRQADGLIRYILFADESPLPPGGVAGDPAFKTAFLRNKKASDDGKSLKDFNLETRLFAHRCSYMIYSGVFQGLPPIMKRRIYDRLDSCLDLESEHPASTHLSPDEKRAIRSILSQTLAGWPPPAS